MTKYKVPLIEEGGVSKVKYDVGKAHVHFVLTQGYAIVTSEKPLKRLAKKKDVEVLEE